MLKRRITKTPDRPSASERIPAGKWIKHVKPETPTPKAVCDCLRLRFETVLYWLPRAAEHPEEDIENVHQLRVSLRRVTTNLRAFRKLLKQEAYRELRESFRTIIKGAGAARDADVLLARFRTAEPDPKSGVGRSRGASLEERKAAQETILEAYRALAARNGFANSSTRRPGRYGRDEEGQEAGNAVWPIRASFVGPPSVNASTRRSTRSAMISRNCMPFALPARSCVTRWKLPRRPSEKRNGETVYREHRLPARLLGNAQRPPSDDPSLRAMAGP